MPYRPMHRLPLFLAASLIYALPVRADCLLPAPPGHIPDGRVASEPEMRAAMRTLQQYNEDVDEYGKCLEFEQRVKHVSPYDQEKQRTVAMETRANVVEQFNQQVRLWKARRS